MESGSKGSEPATEHVSDVLIVGGGLVGGILACALAETGLRVAVVEAAPPEALLAARFDGRASAIALSSRRLLEQVGLWDDVRDEACPMLDIRVSDGDSPLFLHYDHHAIGDEPFGHMVENRYLRRSIFRRLQTLDRVRLLAPTKVVSLDRTAAGVEARLANGARVSAQLAVAADGRDSLTRVNAGIPVTRWAYAQTAIVCTVAHERPHDNVAHEHFLPAGPFAILPLNGNRASIVWTEHTHRTPAIMALDESGFTAELARRFGDFLGQVEVVGPRWSYPLSLHYAATTVGRRLALVGDAAHGMHPIAGQGLNMGFRDVAALAEVLLEARQLGLDLGSGPVLERYRRWRRFDTALMLAMTDALNRLFSNDVGPIRLARELGLAAVDRLPPLKRLFMRHAMGVVGELPRLMRGQAL